MSAPHTSAVLRRISILIVGVLALAWPQRGFAQDDEILTITPAVLDRFLTAYAKETSERDRLFAADPEIRAEMEHQKCMETANSDAARRKCDQARTKGDKKKSAFAEWEECAFTNFPEAATLKGRYQVATKNKDNAELARLQKLSADLFNKAVAKCGPQPEEEDEHARPTDEEMQARYDAEQRAMEKMRELEDQAFVVGYRAGSFSDRQYTIVKERVIAFLRLQANDKDYEVYTFEPAERTALRAYQTRLTAALKDQL
jgi:hypothetical protein